jgi:restriction system protein
MIYICNSCNHTFFTLVCERCGLTEIKEHIPLDPKFYPEFQYQSKGFIKDLIVKKKEVAQIQETLEDVLAKYARLKNPYFINFVHITNYGHTKTPEEINNKWAKHNGSYSELDLFYQTLLMKGFIELKELPHLLHKLLLTTLFEATFLGFKKEIERHIKNTLELTLESWIDETGFAFRQELPLLLYYLWTKDRMMFGLPFNLIAAQDIKTPLIDPDKLQKILEQCETIYYKILVNRLDTKLTRFNPETFVTIHHIDAMDGYSFEDFLVELFREIGYEVEGTKRTGDQGADLFVQKFGQKTVIQAKNYIGSVGNSAVQQALSAKQFYQCDHAMVICNSYFTKSAMELAEAANVLLIDRDKLKMYIEDYNQALIGDANDHYHA